MYKFAEDKYSYSVNKDNSKFQTNTKKETLYVLLLLALVNWVSHFLYFMRFGLYEDDFTNIGIYLGYSFPQILNQITYRLTTWPHGHPLSFLPIVFGHIGETLGGVYFMYVIAFLIVTVNSFLMYRILKKIFPGSELFALSGAILFCLFPPDTTKLYLLHNFAAQVAITFFFTATFLYLNSKKILSYVAITLSIFIFEAPFMVFFGVPFLKGNWDKKFRKEYLQHFMILCLLITLIFFLRKFIGDSRVSEVSGDPLGIVGKTIAGLFIGPVFNIFLFIRAPIATISYLDSSSPTYWWYYDYIYYILIACFLFFLYLFYKLKPDYNPNSEIKSISDSEGTNSLQKHDVVYVNEYFRKLFKIFIASVILICLAYAVSFTRFPPIAIIGRSTAVHMLAVIGGSIIFACMCASIFFLAEKYRLKKYAVILLSLYLALLVVYKTYTQKEFVQSWIFQKTFWSDVIKLCPDLEDSTVILCNIPAEKILPTKHIYTFSPFPDNYMIPYLFKFPQKWKKPFFQNVFGHLERDVSFKDGEFILKSRVFAPTTINDSNVILIKMDKNNNLVRIDSSVTINGKKLHLKPKGKNTIDKFEKTELYDLLIKPE